MPPPQDGSLGGPQRRSRQPGERYLDAIDAGASRSSNASSSSSRSQNLSTSPSHDPTRHRAPSGNANPVSRSELSGRERYDGRSIAETPRTAGRSERITSTSQSWQPPNQESKSRSYVREYGRYQANDSDAQHIGDASATATASAPTSFGNSLWQRVAVAVGSLSLNVGLSLETGTVTGDGERTPAGAESHVTFALKEYYLARAQSGIDLPDWLFSPEERRAAGGIRNAAPSRGDGPVAYARRQSLEEQQRGYYDKEAPRTNEPKNSAGSSRFKQIRDAKRGVDISAKQLAFRTESSSGLVTRKSESLKGPSFRADPAYENGDAENRRTLGPSVRGRGIGLPSGPGGMRRPSSSRR